MSSTNFTNSVNTELIFLGTGTSSSIPNIECLTALPGTKPCQTCLSTRKPEGKKNIRRNTSAVVRCKGKDSQPVTIVIDVGKNFREAAIEWFPEYGLRKIDAVLITHAHADAMNGLDDLRGWTLHNNIQSHIELYVSSSTFTEVQRSFPYLVAKEYASGGGDVPEFKWHVIDDQTSFEIADTGIMVTPFSGVCCHLYHCRFLMAPWTQPVHHGRVFSVCPTPEVTYLPSPAHTPSTGTVPTPPENAHPQEAAPNELDVKLQAVSATAVTPYFSLGFKFRDFVYISDTSHIPENVWSLLLEEATTPVFILDCLRLQKHTSHLGLSQSVSTARRLGAQRTYLTGFSHELSHEEYTTIGELVGMESQEREQLYPNLSDNERKGIDLVEDGESIWLRPAHDGLRILISPDGTVVDNTYR